MIRHIVMWKKKDGVSREDLEELKVHSEKLKEIKDVLALDFYIDSLVDGNHNLMLVVIFNDLDALNRYQVNPVHIEFGKHLNTLACERAAYDHKL